MFLDIVACTVLRIVSQVIKDEVQLRQMETSEHATAWGVQDRGRALLRT